MKSFFRSKNRLYMLSFFFLWLITILIIYKVYTDRIDEVFNKKIEYTEAKYENALKVNALELKLFLHETLNSFDTATILHKAFISDDIKEKESYRELLFNLISPYYYVQVYSKAKSIKFFLADGEGFLLFNGKDDYNKEFYASKDYQQDIMQTSEPSYGYLDGKDGDYYFLFPLLLRGGFAGFVEINIDLKTFLENGYGDEEGFFQIKKTEIESSYSLNINNIETIDKDLSFLFKDSVEKALEQKAKFCADGVFNKTFYDVCFLPLQTYNQKHGGYFISYQKNSDSRSVYINYSIVILIFTIFFVFISYLTYKKNRAQARMNQLGYIVEHSNDEIFIVHSRSLLIQHVNEQACFKLGKKYKEIVGKTIRDIGFNVKSKNLEEFLIQSKNFEIDLKVPKANGEFFEARLRFKKITGDYRDLFIIICEDITDRKDLQANLERQKYFMDTIIETSPNPIAIKSREGKYISGNRAAAQMLGVSLEEFIGKDDFELGVVKEVADRFKEEDEKAFNSKRAFHIEDEKIYGQGQEYAWYKTVRIPLYTEKEDKEQLLLCMATDITSHKQLHDALIKINSQLETRVKEEVREKLKSEEKYKYLFNGIEEAILVNGFDTKENETNYIEVNDRACEIFHKTRDELLQMNPYELFPYYEGEKEFSKHMHKDKIYFKTDLVVNNEEKIVEVQSYNMILQSQTVALTTVKDITEKENLKAEKIEQERILSQQSKMAEMGDMIGAIAHQWRQPLNAVSAAAINLKFQQELELLSEEEIIETADFIETQSSKMSETINDFMDFFKPSKEKEQFSLKTIFDRIIGILGAQLKNRNVDIEFVFEKDATLFGYKNELEHVFLNLIINARDAFENKNIESKWIRVTLEDCETCVEVHVEDSAGGISESVLEKVFNPYFTTKEPGKGTGIGLYMSKMIIERNFKGTLRAKNTDVGAKFSVHIQKELT